MVKKEKFFSNENSTLFRLTDCRIYSTTLRYQFLKTCLEI
jgi:hypothetical protein